MENLGIDLKLIIAQIINFFILFIIFKKFISVPFLNFVKEERRKEEEKNKLLKDMEEKSLKLDEQKKMMKQEQNKEMEKMMYSTAQGAEALRQELIKKAEKEAADIVAKGKLQIEDEKAKMDKQMKSQLIDISTMLVEKGLQNYLDEEKKRAVTQNILNSLPNGK